MKRLNKNQIDIIKQLGIKGLSLRQIQKETTIPLSTVQYHLNRYKGRKKVIQIKLPKSDFIKGEIIGAFAGDGNYFHDTHGRCSKYRISYFLSYKDDKQYVAYLHTLFKKIGLNPIVYIKNNNNKHSVLIISVNSIKLYEYIKENLYWHGIKTYSISLKNGINNFSKKFLLGFARGLMDTDGYVDTYTNSVGCSSTSRELIENLNDIMLKIAITPKLAIRKKEDRKDLYSLRVPRKYLRLYQNKIGFSNLRKRYKLLKIIQRQSGSKVY